MKGQADAILAGDVPNCPRRVWGQAYLNATLKLGAYLLPFLQLRVGAVAGLELNISLLLSLFIFPAALLINGVKRNHLLALPVALLYPLIILVVARDPDLNEFLKSYSQFCYLCIAIFISLNLPVDHLLPHCKRLVAILTCITTIVGIWTIVQCIALNVFGNTSLLNPFGQFSPRFAGALWHPLPREVLRTNSIYSEPSFAAWLLVLVASIGISFEKPNRARNWKVAICCMAAISTFAFSAFINVAALFVSSLLTSLFQSESSRVLKVLVYSLAIALVGIGLAASGVGERVKMEWSNPRSSIYDRVVFPTLLIADSLPMYPFGYPLGQSKFAADRSYTTEAWHDEMERGQIQNSFGIVGFHFGVPGLLFSIFIVVHAIRRVLVGSRDAPVWVALLLAFSQSGRLWAPEMVAVTTYVIVITRSNNYVEQSVSVGRTS